MRLFYSYAINKIVDNKLSEDDNRVTLKQHFQC